MIHLEPWQWALVTGCAFLNGVAKTGVPGLGILVVVLMLWVIPDGRLSGGAVLPMLCLADLFAVLFYRRHAQWQQIIRLSPWVGAGLVAGLLTLWLVSNDGLLNRLMGGVIMTMVLLHAQRLYRSDPPVLHGWWYAALFGIIAGFATTVANAAGPVMSLYLVSMALPKDQFMGTGAWFFCLINLVKIPLFLLPDHDGHTRITADTLWLDACVAPAIIAGALLGRRIFSFLPERTFAWIVLLLAGLGALKLVVY